MINFYLPDSFKELDADAQKTLKVRGQAGAGERGNR